VSGISVVIPCFNSASTLERAVTSVAAQTLAPAEVIIVDDASTDGTADVARSLAHDHPQLHLIVIELDANVGAGAARNAGWERASGTWVAFLDADDAWHPEKLRIQHGIMTQHPGCVLGGHRYRVDASGQLGDFDTGTPRTREVSLRKLLLRNVFSTPSVMVRRDVAERFHPDPRVSDDYLLWMRIVASHGPALLVDLPLTTLFKDAYGHSGLSGSTHAMQRRELTAFAHLHRDGHVSAATRTVASAWSLLKYLRRIVLLGFRNR
jgi:glycosyltransferase involved in cell wall biosynthesis